MQALTAAERLAIAAAVELNDQYLYQCLTGRRKLPADRCPDVERESGARITCEQLRADVVWIRVPDAAWPHRDGRPCIDAAASKKPS